MNHAHEADADDANSDNSLMFFHFTPRILFS